MLHGLQRHGWKNTEKNWNTLWLALGIDDYFYSLDGVKMSTTLSFLDQGVTRLNNIKNGTRDAKDLATRLSYILKIKHHRRRVAEYLIKNVIVPIGIPRGSDAQGGQHQGVINKSVTWPVDFVTSLLIDGKAINMVNFWKHEDINAGDDLMLYLEDKPFTDYTLSHHPKSMKKQSFGVLQRWEIPRGLHLADRLDDGALRAYSRMWEMLGEVNGMLPDTSDNTMTTRNAIVKTYGAVDDDRLKKDWNIQAHYNDAIINGKVALPDVTKKEAMDALETALVYMDGEDSTEFNNFMSTLGAKLVNSKAVLKDFRKLVDEYRTRKGERRKTSLRAREEFDTILVDESIYQLVPGVSSSRRNAVKEAVWKNGYWHIARCQMQQFAYGDETKIPNGAESLNYRGPLLEVTFSPVWNQPLEAPNLSDGGGGFAASFAVDPCDLGPASKKRFRDNYNTPDAEHRRAYPVLYEKGGLMEMVNFIEESNSEVMLKGILDPMVQIKANMKEVKVAYAWQRTKLSDDNRKTIRRANKAYNASLENVKAKWGAMKAAVTGSKTQLYSAITKLTTDSMTGANTGISAETSAVETLVANNPTLHEELVAAIKAAKAEIDLVKEKIRDAYNDVGIDIEPYMYKEVGSTPSLLGAQATGVTSSVPFDIDELVTTSVPFDVDKPVTTSVPFDVDKPVTTSVEVGKPALKKSKAKKKESETAAGVSAISDFLTSNVGEENTASDVRMMTAEDEATAHTEGDLSGPTERSEKSDKKSKFPRVQGKLL